MSVRTSRVGPDGSRVAYHCRPSELDPAKPVTMLLHGFTGNGDTMSPLGDSLTPACHQTICVDLPGHGASDAPDDVEAYTMTATIDRLRDIAAQERLDAIDVVGYSLGGRVALSLAAASPALVRTLTLVGATPGIAHPTEAEARRESDAALAGSLLTPESGADQPSALEVFVDRWMALPMWNSLEARIGPDAWQRSRTQRLSSSAVGLANSLLGCGTGTMPPLHEHLREVRAPTLLLVGAEDTKFLAIATQMAEVLPNANLVSVPEAGHAAHLEQPETTARAIRAHLTGRVEPDDQP